MDISVQEKGRIAKAVIAAFPEKHKGGQKVNRPLFATIAMYVAENPGVTTYDIGKKFGFYCKGRNNHAARRLTWYYLKSLRDAQIISNELSPQFIPVRKRELASGRMITSGLNVTVKKHTALWYIAQPDQSEDQLQAGQQENPDPLTRPPPISSGRGGSSFY